MIWGASGKIGKKKSTATRPRKKFQLNNLEESSPASCRGKKTQQSVGRGKKREFSALHPQIINGPSPRWNWMEWPDGLWDIILRVTSLKQFMHLVRLRQPMQCFIVESAITKISVC